MNLLVGCPIRDRAWIVPAWMAHLHASCDQAGVTAELLFVGDPADGTTWAAIDEHRAGRVVHRVVADEPADTEAAHSWPSWRKQRMVDLRNTLLAAVRDHAPDAFLSLDSDILVHRATVANLLESLARFDVVGGHCYLSRGTASPSAMRHASVPGCWYRNDHRGGVTPVHVVMAIKAMSPPAYTVDYQYDQWGEDIGWSRAVRAVGLRIGWDTRTVNKHIMYPGQLETRDRRYDW